MAYMWVAIFVLAAASLGSAAHSEEALEVKTPVLPFESDEATLPFREAIVNGYRIRSADTFEHVSAVFIVNERGSMNLCTGSLVHSHAVLVAAHCIDGPHQGVTACFGSTDLRITRGQCYEAASTVIHPLFNSSSVVGGFDVGFLLFSEPISRKPAQIDFRGFLTQTGRNAVAFGYGAVRDSIMDYRLRRVPIPLKNANDCATLRMLDAQRYRLTCGGGRVGEDVRGICQGDSGGPLQIKQNGEFKILGVASFFINSCESGYESVFTRLAAHRTRTFIETQLQYADSLVMRNLS